MSRAMIEVLLEARRLVALPDNDFSWSSFIDAEHALREIDAYLEHVRSGATATGGIGVLFLPTGPLQELSLSSGWGDEFRALANRYDAAAAELSGVAVHLCATCLGPAGKLEVVGDQLRRESFTGTLTQAATPAIREALGDAAALYALDAELTPFYCPQCRESYCGEHWRRRDVFDDDDPTWRDSIRGTCPQGHERMLED